MKVGASAAKRFQDEWLVRAVSAKMKIAPEIVERLRQEGRPFLSEALIGEGLATPQDLERALFDAYQIPMVRPTREDVDKLAASLVPEAVCRRRCLLPLRLKEDRLEVVMANPLDAEALDDVRGMTGRTPVPFFCPPGALSALIDAVHDPDGAVFDLLGKVGTEEEVEVVQDSGAPQPPQEDVSAPVIRLVNMLVSNAVRRRASDIHIEHEEAISLVRYRIDGMLCKVVTLPPRLAAGAVIARLKIMAGLDIANHMRPQDGRAALKVGGRDIGLRVSTLPTQYGEKAVIRILDKRSAEVPLDELGFAAEQRKKLKELARSAQGLIIVTGPTGSGKTTTLYALLNMLRGEDVNITTIEDPVEYRLEKINQVQVVEKQGLGFAQVLRSVLRQDPDIIMVGEIRDKETAEVAIQAAMTGHLVLTTLHTNDALGAVARLGDMGIEPYKIGPALLGVTAQRLARRLCGKCRKPDEERRPYYKAGGCEACEGSGYRGRLSLLELFTPDADLRRMIGDGEKSDALRRAALERGCLHEMHADVLWHLRQGDTSFEEALPYLNSEARAQVPADGSPAPVCAPRRPRVLVADDDPTTRTMLRLALERGGCEALEAADGRQGLSRAAGGVDLVLTDLNMPEMDGRAMIRHLRGDTATAGLPIIVLTADTDDRSQQEALEAGADDYVAKPFKAPLLMARVKAALRRKGASLPGA